MTELLATQVSRGHRTLCLPITEESYRQIVRVPAEFRRTLDDCFRQDPRVAPGELRSRLSTEG